MRSIQHLLGTILASATLCAFALPQSLSSSAGAGRQGSIIPRDRSGCNDSISFRGLPAGTILSQVVSDGGRGPIQVYGINPDIGGNNNTALIFDSDNPTGGDFDLGSPNETFGGPGIGDDGQIGMPHENSTRLREILIIAEDLDDFNNDGLVDDPDDAYIQEGGSLTFDFSAIGPVFVDGMRMIDIEFSEDPSVVDFYDESNALIASIQLQQTGNNGVIFQPLSAGPITRMVINVKGSGGYDNIIFHCWKDCNENGVLDSLDISNGTSNDCNQNGIPDECEPDCDSDGIPDECESDCNANGTPDDCELLPDCNSNGIPDDCEDLSDCDQDGTPDVCEPDCDNDGIPDDCDGPGDCDNDGIPDSCEDDCDNDGTPDDCEPDCDNDGFPDDCEPDCDNDGTPDDCEPDCDSDGTPDDCEPDCDNDGIPDDCEDPGDCDNDGIPDSCENDCDNDGTPDDCEPDCDNDGTPDDCELDCDNDGTPDDCEPDCDNDGTPDDCEPDCNNDGVPDDCDTTGDCDNDGTPDECEPDCDNDGIPDDCEPDCDNDGVPNDCEPDCNDDGTPDDCEIDCDDDGTPDECEPDCDNDGTPDDCEVDCDGDGTPDDCEPDCDNDGTPDDCEPDCDNDGTPDDCEPDCDNDGTPDDCEPDCDDDGLPDGCEIDCDNDGTPDDCEPDCDNDGTPDSCEPDCDTDGIPDDCEPDCDSDGTPDDCELDCDDDGTPDDCELDCDNDGTPDGCEPDCDNDGTPDDCESDCDNDGTPDDCEPDCDNDGTPDECEPDCDNDGTPDDCEPDCDNDGTPDDCEPDCDNDGIPDDCDSDNCCQGRIGDYVWEDLNDNNVQDSNEPGIAGVQLTLSDGLGGTLATTTTDSNGMYIFEELCPGTYFVTVDDGTVPNGLSPVSCESGSNDAIDSNCSPAEVVLVADPPGPVEDLTIDFGYAPCGECDGKVSELTMRYDGPSTVFIDAIQKNGEVRFSGQVAPGESFSFFGTDNGSLGTEVKIYENNVLALKLHTSCSKPIFTGQVLGSYTILGGKSKNGGPLCDSGGCGGCDGKITSLTLTYLGSQAADIRVAQGSEDSFNGSVQPGGQFTFTGLSDDGTMGTSVKIYVNGVQNADVHTSCSQPIGPGAVFGDFEVLEGHSRYGGLLCDSGAEVCVGHVHLQAIVMEYTGDSCNATSHSQDPSKVFCNDHGTLTNQVRIVATDGGSREYLDQIVTLGELFTIDATAAGESKLKAETHIDIYSTAGNHLLQEVHFHTSCSQPLFIDNQFGASRLENYTLE